MNARLVFCIALGVFTAHIGVIMLLSHLRPQVKFVPPPKPNFSATAKVVVDSETGEKLIYREITVSTKLAPHGESAPAEASRVDARTLEAPSEL